MEGHASFVGRLSANPRSGPGYITTRPVADSYSETNQDRHCTQGSQCSGIVWRLVKWVRQGRNGFYDQTWETRCPFASELSGTGKFCERHWWENLYDTIPEHTHDSDSS